jgi:hypothetical protein
VRGDESRGIAGEVVEGGDEAGVAAGCGERAGAVGHVLRPRGVEEGGVVDEGGKVDGVGVVDC